MRMLARYPAGVRPLALWCARSRSANNPQEEADQLAEFDVKKLKTSELVMLGGCLAVFIGVFLKWFAVGGGTVGDGAFRVSIPEFSVNGFHYFFQGTLPWLLAVAVAAVIIIRAFVPNVKLPDKVGSLGWGELYLIACGAAAFLVLTRLLMGDSGTDRKLGLFLASLGSIAMAVGAFLKFQAKEEDAPAGGATPPTPF
jgi:hypothetical protein